MWRQLIIIKRLFYKDYKDFIRSDAVYICFKYFFFINLCINTHIFCSIFCNLLYIYILMVDRIDIYLWFSVYIVRISIEKTTRRLFARQVAEGGTPFEEIRKFGKSFDLRFTAWSRLSARHFADDESTPRRAGVALTHKGRHGEMKGSARE